MNSYSSYTADVMSTSDYYPFGSPLPGRQFDSPKYKYGFNGHEKDDEVKGNGNSYDFGARIFDPRVGRWLSVDPLTGIYPYASPYNFALNTPIQAKDPDGKRVKISIWTKVFAPKVAKAYRIMLSTQSGQATFGDYMSRRQSRKYLGKNVEGQYHKQVNVKLTHSLFEGGYTSIKVKTEEGWVSDKETFIHDYSTASKVKLTIKVGSNSGSLGSISQTVAHEVGLHAGGLLDFSVELLKNPENYKEISSKYRSHENLDKSTSASKTHWEYMEYGDGKSYPRLYDVISQEMKGKLNDKEKDNFDKKEKEDKSFGDE